MFKHIVCVDFKEDCKDKLGKAKSMIQALAKKIDVIRNLEVGLDELGTERSYDLAIVADFDSRTDWQVYDTHPEHVKVKDFIKDLKADAVAVDFTYMDKITI